MAEGEIGQRGFLRRGPLIRLAVLVVACALGAIPAKKPNPEPVWLSTGTRPPMFSRDKPFSEAFETYLEKTFPPEQRLAASRRSYPLVNAARARNCILLIGDGMGLNHVGGAALAAYGVGGRLALQRMPVMGLVTTFSSSSLFTDSGAAATALATGFKTYNGALAIDPWGWPLESWFATAKRHGKRTGLVVTSSLTNGTPAAFVANAPWRTLESEVAAQLLERDVNVLLGGGARYFIARGDASRLSLRTDERDLLQEALQRGYQLTFQPAELARLDGDHVLGLFAWLALSGAARARPTLADMTSKSLQLLARDGRGFCLMVEGSQIDWRSHEQDFEGAVWETLEFDRAVECCLRFAEQDGQTLVVVTADHETGGLALAARSAMAVEGRWAYTRHTAAAVPLWAYGPGCLDFAGVQDNTDVPVKIARTLGLDDFPALRARIAAQKEPQPANSGFSPFF